MATNLAIDDELLARALEIGGEKCEIYGFRAIPAGGAVVSNALVNELREDLGI